jgi:hypothetical protein
MPIHPNRLDPILVVDETATVRQVVGTLLSGEPYNQWYTVVLRRESGDLNAFALVELNDDAERLGSAVLDTRLGELLQDRPPARTVERTETNPNKAERDASRAPGKRLLVLEAGEPVGVVAIKSRGRAQKAAVVDLYRTAAEPGPEALTETLAALDTNFLLLRPHVTLAEVDHALARADVRFAIAPLYDNRCVLLSRQDVKPHLDELGRYTLHQIYAVRKAGERRPGTVAPGKQVSQVRPNEQPLQDEIVLQDGKPIGFRPGLRRGGGKTLLPDVPKNGGDERYVNAWFEGHAPSEALARGTQYDLGINVGAQRDDSYVVGEAYEGPVDRDIYVGLVGDPNVWQIDGPAVQKLHIPAGGDSEAVFFKVTPLKQGQQQLVAHFYYRNHLIQTVEITGVQVAIPDEGGAVAGRGQKPVAVTLTRAAAGTAASDRDANLYIEWLPDQDRFRFSFFSASPEADGEPVLHSARVPLTADEMTVMADAARDTIETHLIRYKEGENRPFLFLSKDKTQQPSDTAYQKAIMELAQLGYRWFIRLFYSQKEPDLVAEAEAMGDLLLQASAGGRLRLQVVSSDFYLPWNLFYTPPSGEREPLSGETASVEGIWGFRHVIEQVPARDLSHVHSGPIIDASDGLEMSASINLMVDGSKLKPASDQVKYFEAKADKPELKLNVTTRFTEQDVLKAFRDRANTEEIVYFYCHAVTEGDPKTRFQESRLILTQEAQALELGDLITATFGMPPLSKAPLVFLNACGSAEMDAQFYDSFVQFMRDRGARTVIGTLNNTPTVVGAVFAMSFFEQFLQGGPEHSAAQLLFDLRRQFLDAYRNPVGLSYALFYNGDTFVLREWS